MSKEEEMTTNTRKRRRALPKDQAKSVAMQLDDETRIKLLDLNELHQKRAMCDLPLSTSMKFAVAVAHRALFGDDARAESEEPTAHQPD